VLDQQVIHDDLNHPLMMISIIPYYTASKWNYRNWRCSS